jgi:hypothetical protein
MTGPLLCGIDVNNMESILSLQHLMCIVKQGVKLKGYYPYFGVQPFTFPSKYFANLQKGSGNFL